MRPGGGPESLVTTVAVPSTDCVARLLGKWTRPGAPLRASWRRSAWSTAACRANHSRWRRMNSASTTSPGPGTKMACGPPTSRTRSSVAGQADHNRVVSVERDHDDVGGGVAVPRVGDRPGPGAEVEHGAINSVLRRARGRDPPRRRRSGARDRGGARCPTSGIRRLRVRRRYRLQRTSRNPGHWSKCLCVTMIWVITRPAGRRTSVSIAAASGSVVWVSTSSAWQRPCTNPIVTSQNGSRRRCTLPISCSQAKRTDSGGGRIGRARTARRRTMCRKLLTCREYPTYIAVVASPDRVFLALANPVRRELLEILSREPRSAGELNDRFELSRPAVAEHLKVLREAGLVADEARGRRRIYRLTAEPLAELGEWLHPFEKFWRGRLAALAEAAEELE
jgi:DNA-binding transcriptional ArsR family regulator